MSAFAIEASHISKSFIVPHQQVRSIRSAFVQMFQKKSYDLYTVLNDVSLAIQPGEFIGIIGRNGSGKSTLLKILAGIYPPDKGSVKIHGELSPFLELGIGFHPELSGRDNIYLNGTILGLTKRQIDHKLEEIIAFSELERFIDQKLKNYSSGMHVRLAFSVAIHADKDIFLMDEVLAVGDARFQQKCIAFFMEQKRLGKTIILVTHGLAEVEQYCDRAILIDQGHIRSSTTPKEATRLYKEILGLPS